MKEIAELISQISEYWPTAEEISGDYERTHQKVMLDLEKQESIIKKYRDYFEYCESSRLASIIANAKGDIEKHAPIFLSVYNYSAQLRLKLLYVGTAMRHIHEGLQHAKRYNLESTEGYRILQGILVNITKDSFINRQQDLYQYVVTNQQYRLNENLDDWLKQRILDEIPFYFNLLVEYGYLNHNPIE